MAEHFIGINRLLRVVKLSEKMDDPLEIIAELDCVEEDEEEQPRQHPPVPRQAPHSRHRDRRR
jgi:helicase